tara:strand:- start:455 stop:1123 length:669 start_codon:yes stop_codon:yes gene_type:complete
LKLKRIKIVIFDAYGTLFDVNSAVKKLKNKIGPKWIDFANYWRTTQLEYTWLRSLLLKHKNFWDITNDSLDKSMKVFDIKDSLKNDLLSLYKSLNVFSEVREVLKYLKKKNVKIAILSNGTFSMISNLVKLNEIDEFIDDIFSVEDKKIYKPSPKIYQIPLSKYKCSNNEVLFLSSNTWDISGAGHFGFNCLWVNRSSSFFDCLDYNDFSEIKNLNGIRNFI